jgi:hypothetical protein
MKATRLRDHHPCAYTGWLVTLYAQVTSTRSGQVGETIYARMHTHTHTHTHPSHPNKFLQFNCLIDKKIFVRTVQ